MNNSIKNLFTTQQSHAKSLDTLFNLNTTDPNTPIKTKNTVNLPQMVLFDL